MNDNNNMQTLTLLEKPETVVLGTGETHYTHECDRDFSLCYVYVKTQITFDVSDYEDFPDGCILCRHIIEDARRCPQCKAFITSV
jgi:hypothetical protein